MKQALNQPTFTVADVEIFQQVLPTISYQQGIETLLGCEVEACDKKEISLINPVKCHPFLRAVHLAFSEHYPLVLSPDAIWLCLIQGLATHINANAEKFRHLFVDHEGKKTIAIRRDDFFKGSPDNPWSEVISQFSHQIQDFIGDKHSLIIADFSTTTTTEKTVSEIVLMDTVNKYFEYLFFTFCGIPQITLTGTLEDWVKIRTRIEQFSQFDLQWWVETLIPILDEFILAFQGEIHRDFWKSFYNFNEMSGGAYATGWINVFFPYLKDTQNPYVQNWQQGMNNELGGGLSIDELPIGYNLVTFKWQYLDTVFNMNFIGGFLGVHQDKNNFAISPEIGWAICEEGALDLTWDQDHI